MPVFSATLLLSAFLLFIVQPMVGKMILPMLGGSPQVWNTAMLCFQALLLGGYAYAHITTRFLGIRAQAVLHIVLLCGCLAILPIAIPASWPAPDTNHPILWQLTLIMAIAGAPFFILAGSAPMLQRWFFVSGSPGASNPYFLYAASNLGSMLALLGYPLVAEPLLTLHEQSEAWKAGFFILIVLTALAAALSGKDTPSIPKDDVTFSAPFPLKLKWLVLAFLPSSLMMGVTTYITTDLAAVPLLWVLPLSLYVLTFILVFANHTFFKIQSLTKAHLALILAVVCMPLLNSQPDNLILILAHLILFFVCAMLCHTELARLRPPASGLTEYYLILSLGGVLGGIFNVLIAPKIFPLPYEYPLILALVAFVRFDSDQKQKLTLQFLTRNSLRNFIPLAIIAISSALAAINYGKPSLPFFLILPAAAALTFIFRERAAYGIGVLIMLACHPGVPWNKLKNLEALERNFFGVSYVTSESGKIRILYHGTTAHGSQALVDPYKLVPLGYYYTQGPVGDIFNILSKKSSPQKIAALGLGVGNIACYTGKNRSFDFYEIDPAVPKIAQNPRLFTYLSECGSPYTIIMGDARLNVRNAPDQTYDMIFLDVFTSDNIPVHLLTSEAFDIYKRKLRHGGIIVSHISNRFFSLTDVIRAAGHEIGATVLFKNGKKVSIMDPYIYAYPSVYAVLLTDPADISAFQKAGWKSIDAPLIRPWTDDYANILHSLIVKGKNDMALSP